MKVFKIVVGIVAALIALVIVLAGIALIPAVQSWALRKAVAGQPGLKIEFARVAAGPSSARIEGLRVAKDGMVVSARNADARYSAWDFLFHHRISVDDLTVTDLVLDLRHPTQTGATAPSPTHSGPQPAVSGPKQPGSTFNGILSQITLPYSVQIARFSVPGRVLLPGEQTLTFELRGNDISTGRRGTIDWRADLTNPERNAAFSSLHSSGTVNLHITTEQRIDEAEFHALASAVGPKLPTEQLKLEAKAEQPAEGGNEGYSAVVSIVRDSASAPLITLAAQFAPATHAISGAWEVSIHNEQLADLLTGFGLPNLAATGAGKFGANPGTNAITASGEIQADVSHLEKISPNLAPVGTLHLQSRFNGGMADNTVQLAQIELTATASDGRQLADLRTLQPIGFSLGSKRVTLPNPNAELARVSVQSLPVAWAQPFVKPLQIVSGDLSLALAVASNADGSQVRLTSVDPVFVRNLTVRNGSEPMFDQLTVRVKPQVNYSAGKIHAQLTDLNASMPTGDDVTGTMTADITPANGQPTIAFTADTRAKVVAALKPYLPPEAAPMIVSASSSGTMRGDQLRFDRSDVTVTRESGASVLKFALLQPLTVDTKNNTFQGSNSHTATARVQFGEVPLSWAARVVKNGALAGNLAGGTVDLTLRTATDIAATTTQPIRFQNVSATLAGQPQLDSIDASVEFSASKKNDAVTYDVRELRATHGTTALLSLNVSGGAELGAKPSFSAKGHLQADAAALMQQPVAASHASLARGNIDASFDAHVAATVQANASIHARNLVARQDNRPLGDASLEVTATVQPDGSSVLRIPLAMTNGTRKSDLLVDGKLARTGNSIRFDGRITSEQLVIDDLQPLASLVSGSTTPPSTGTRGPAQGATPPAASVSRAGVPPPSAVPSPTSVAAQSEALPRDTQPFWNGFGGAITLDLKQITYGSDYVIRNVTGSATASPTQLALAPLQGQFKDNAFKISGAIGFDSRKTQPYVLNASANIPNVDVGAILKAANPGQPPQLETKVTIAAKLDGKGGNLTELAQNIYGTFDASGSKGVLRALAGNVGRVSSGLSLAAGLIGAAQNSQGWDAAAGLTQKLSNLPFDRFAMHVERGADLNLKVSSIEFVTPDTHITGSGTVTNQPGVPITNQPMRFTLQLGGKGDMAVLLQRVGLLGNQRDNLGYSMMGTTFTLTGTPAKANPSDFWRIVGQAALRAAAGHFLGR